MNLKNLTHQVKKPKKLGNVSNDELMSHCKTKLYSQSMGHHTIQEAPLEKKNFKINSCASEGDENEIDQKLETYTA